MLCNMKDLLIVAQKNKFAIPAFNISSYEMFTAVIETAIKFNSPVIFEIHPDELAFIGADFIESMKSRIKSSNIPAVIHLDHGANMEDILKAIQAGFTSVMIDGSRLPYDNNVEITKRVVEIAHFVGVSVEAELGTIGVNADTIEDGTDEIVYTDPSLALDFVEKTGVDTLAVAIGTAHGLYPKDYKPKLQLDLISRISKLVDLPLVLHGGSGNPDEEIKKAAELGICKVNISSDIKNAYFCKLRNIINENDKAYEPNVIFPKCMKEVSSVVSHKFDLLGSKDKVLLY